jgi:hypothetical protein
MDITLMIHYPALLNPQGIHLCYSNMKYKEQFQSVLKFVLIATANIASSVQETE